MLVETTTEKFKHYFPKETNPFIKQDFINLNQYKVEHVIRLVQDIDKPSIGLITGIRDGNLLSPFSAPFGGFHYSHENIYINEIESFAEDLKKYLIGENYQKVSITFPPSIYGGSFNAKMINVLCRKHFKILTPDLTNWVDLRCFEGKFAQRNSREYYNQALRNKITFKELVDINEKEKAYELIVENRKRFGRPIYMGFEDLVKAGELWPVDFHGVFSQNDVLIAAGIFYQFHGDIAFAVFWGDNELGRPLRAMDFLSFNLWIHYKDKGFSFIDLGISTEGRGLPNEGLLRFKETHECNTELKNTLVWETNPE
jgi:hypothetical protein